MRGMEIVLAVDGNSLAHRSYHAFGPRDGGSGECDASGRPVWAVNGFLNLLAGIIEKVRPTRLVVGFDDVEHSLRRTKLPSYKATRSEKSDALVEQIERISSVLKALGVCVVVPSGLEADDVVAGAARWARDNAAGCVIATSDRDSFALIDAGTRVLRLANGGLSQAELLDEEALVAKYGVTPARYRLFAALRGDSSDNLPGVSGVGEKTAAKIVGAVGTVEELLSASTSGGLTGVVGPSVLKKLQDEESVERLRLNDEMMRLVEHVFEMPSGLGTEVGVLEVLRKEGLKENSRLVRALGGADAASTTAEVVEDAGMVERGVDVTLEPELQIPAVESPADALISARLRASAEALGLTRSEITPAPRPAQVQPMQSVQSEVARPPVLQVPNPRPRRSLLVEGGLGGS